MLPQPNMLMEQIGNYQSSHGCIPTSLQFTSKALWPATPIIRRLRGDLEQIGDLDESQHLQSLGKTLKVHLQEALERTPSNHSGLGTTLVSQLVSQLVVLNTPTALKVSGVNPRAHHCRVKMAHQQYESHQWKAQADPMDPLQLHLWRDPTH